MTRLPPSPTATLVDIATPTTPLDGLYYEPAETPTRGAVLYFHGNTMNFYTGGAKFLPPMLTSLGLACLVFNRRGHDVLSTRDDKESLEGGAFQTTAQALEDCAIAATWLARQGHPAPVVIGHSNGGMLATQHTVDHPSTRALVLLSAGAGGPATSQRHGLLAGGDLSRWVKLAEQMVQDGRGGELMLMPGWWYVITAESFLDRLATAPDTINLAPEIKCSVLAVRGDLEPAESFPVEQFVQRVGGPGKAKVIENCDHFYRGREAAVISVIEDFLIQLLDDDEEPGLG